MRIVKEKYRKRATRIFKIWGPFLPIAMVSKSNDLQADKYMVIQVTNS
jgi:hypothetical protein